MNVRAAKRIFSLILILGLMLSFEPPSVQALNLAVTPPKIEAQSRDIQVLQQISRAFAAVVHKAAPAVVFVQVERIVEQRGPAFGPEPFPFEDPFHFFGPDFFERFFGQRFPRKFRQMGAGSGFIVSPDGYILTNNHVVGKADKITVKLADGRQFRAKVVGTDPQSDIAVIKIDADNLPILPLGDSDKIEVGEWVLAIGNPFGLTQTVTVGIVSAKGRSGIGITDYEDFIQTDAAINPGNSGGPLVNLKGEAIGINTAIFSRSGGYMGIGFAIPANMARIIMDQLIKTGKVTRGWLGIVIQDLNEDLARSFGLKEPEGALVTEVAKESPAAKAGLKSGDVIVSFNGRKVKNVAELRNQVALTSPGTKATITVIRDGRLRKLRVVIGEQPKRFGFPTRNELLEKLGFSVRNLTPDLAKELGYKPGQGVVVDEVLPGSPAALAGIRPGHLIEEVNRKKVHNLKEFLEALSAGRSNQILLLVRDHGYSRYVLLRLE
ncbi:DegQ family serine endoprotease [Thermosulfuriphilus sp.]